jgi:aldehyde:ferredoxin oxidoreductase
MRAEYYESLGWDERGVPRAESLRELEIDGLVGEPALAGQAS